MRSLIIGLFFLSISFSAFSNNYPGKEYICKNCASKDQFVDYMWAGLSRLEFTDRFYVFVFDETYDVVIRVTIRASGSKWILERSGLLVGEFKTYGPVDFDTLRWLRGQAARKFNVSVKPKPGGGSGRWVRPPPPGGEPPPGGGGYRN